MPPSSKYPGSHPDPPSELPTRQLPIILDQRIWYRLHRTEHSPLYFGRSGSNRFDAPDGEFGVLYLGDSPHCCFVETYGCSDHGDHRIITHLELGTRRLSVVEFNRRLRPIDLTGAGLARIGADNRLGTGDYQVAQRWARALWSHADQPDGLLYRSRHDPSRRCLALFNRVASFVSSSDAGSLIDPANVAVLAEILEAHGIGYLA